MRGGATRPRSPTIPTKEKQWTCTLYQVLRSKVGGHSGLNASLKFDCGGEGVIVIDGDACPTPSTTTTAKPTARSPSAWTTWSPCSGELEPTTGFMMGKLKVSGDMSVAMKLQHLL